MLVIGDGVGEPGTTSRGCHTDVPEEETYRRAAEEDPECN